MPKKIYSAAAIETKNSCKTKKQQRHCKHTRLALVRLNTFLLYALCLLRSLIYMYA